MILVTDLTAPVMTCPADITAEAMAYTRAAMVSFHTTATDSVDGVVAATPDRASGTAFEVGSTNVTFTAVDSSWNYAYCTFTVTVWMGGMGD